MSALQFVGLLTLSLTVTETAPHLWPTRLWPTVVARASSFPLIAAATPLSPPTPFHKPTAWYEAPSAPKSGRNLTGYEFAYTWLPEKTQSGILEAANVDVNNFAHGLNEDLVAAFDVNGNDFPRESADAKSQAMFDWQKYFRDLESESAPSAHEVYQAKRSRATRTKF